MLFTSWIVLFAIFVTWLVYFSPWFRTRQLILLVVLSLGVYAYEAPGVLALLLASALTNAMAAYRVANATDAAARKTWAVGGVAFNLLVLAFFKYNRLLADSISAQWLGAQGDWIQTLLLLPLPIGVSFYTFHGISLLVDTWRGHYRPSPLPGRHLGQTLLYLCFFPQLVAGPITKANYFYPQIGPKTWADIDASLAARSLLMGYFLKLVVANNLANHTFTLQYPYFLGLPKNELLLLLLGFSVQIFADFAGYSLIAIGLAALFGYRLPDNFNFPYIARSFSDFWRRWHISLSSWLRDYLYFPLGGNRKGPWRTGLNLWLVMVLGGLWHGAAWSYAIWGAWHGFALLAERAWFGGSIPTQRPVWARVGHGVLVFVVVTVGWLLFKLPQFNHVLAYLQELVNAPWQTGLSNRSRAILLLSLPVLLYHLRQWRREHGHRDPLDGAGGWVRALAVACMVYLLMFNSGPDTPFIYFQF